MLEVANLGYDSWQTVCFQRTTVIVTDLMLAFALYRYGWVPKNIRWNPRLMTLLRYVHTFPATAQRNAHAVALSIILSPALLIIDHIHFQYNGFLYGILILSLVLARKQSTMVFGGLLFAALICLKHIYLYLAPAYFIYLLRAYCLSQRTIFHVRFGNCVKLGSAILVVFGAAFGPFYYWAQLDQVLKRLFPFSRGLCHAYWAPNIWSMYSFTDRALIHGNNAHLPLALSWLTAIVASRLRLPVDQSAVNSVTRGLVGDTSFAVLPNVSPRTTFTLTLSFQVVRTPRTNPFGHDSDRTNSCT